MWAPSRRFGDAFKSLRHFPLRPFTQPSRSRWVGDAAHLYSFSFGAEGYRANPLEKDALDRTVIASVAKKGDRFTYTYDFGDNWCHEVTVEDVISAGRTSQPAFCIAGELNAPPEDCGGLSGFEAILNGKQEPPNYWNKDTFVRRDVNLELAELFGIVDYRDNEFVDDEGSPLPSVYDPERPLDEVAWEKLEQDEQLWAIAAYHHWMEENNDHSPTDILRSHALMHATIELHVAGKEPAEASRALAALCANGHSRHQAVHILADALEEAMATSSDGAPESYRSLYIERLNALANSVVSGG